MWLLLAQKQTKYEIGKKKFEDKKPNPATQESVSEPYSLQCIINLGLQV